MKHPLFKSAPITLRKNTLSRAFRKVVFIFSLSAAAGSISSCEEEIKGPIVVDICPPGDPCQNPPVPVCCTPVTAVTVENVGCGVGVWGAYWLRTDNGTLLQPWLSNVTAPINPGERYLIDYALVQRDHLYDSVITCMALVPMGTPIRINCMQTEGTPN